MTTAVAAKRRSAAASAARRALTGPIVEGRACRSLQTALGRRPRCGEGTPADVDPAASAGDAAGAVVVRHRVQADDLDRLARGGGVHDLAVADVHRHVA